MLKWNFPYRGWEKTSLLWALCLLLVGSVGASAQSLHQGRNFKIVSPNTITARYAKQLLDTIGLGTVSPMPGTNDLLITADSNQLSKVLAVMSVADRRDVYAVRNLGSEQLLKQWTSPSKLALALGHVTIADFNSQSTNNIKGDILLDTYRGKTWLVAPRSKLEHMAVVISAGPQALAAPSLQTLSATDKTDHSNVATNGRLSDDNMFKPVITAANPSPWASSPTALLASDANTVTSQSKTGPTQLAKPNGVAQNTTITPITPSHARTTQSTTVPTSPLKKAGASQQPTGSLNPPQNPNIAQGKTVPLRSAKNGEASQSKSLSPATQKDVGATQSTTVPLESSAKTGTSQSTTVPLSTSKAVPSHSSEEYTLAPLPSGDEPLNLHLKEKLPITELLALVGKYYKLDYMYDPSEVNGDITLRLEGEMKGPLKVKHLYPLLEFALKSKHLVMTRKGNLVWVVPESKVMEVDPELMTKGGLVEYGDVVLTRVFHLNYISTDTAENLLDQMKLQIQVTPIPETKTLIVTAYAYRLPRIERLLKLVDKKGEPKQFRYRQLKYTLAKNLADKVKSLSEQLTSVNISVSEEKNTPQAITQNRGESDAAFRARRARELARRRIQQNARNRSRSTNASNNDQDTSNAVYLDADERTNRVLMIGHKDQLDIVENLINSLDVAQQDLRTLKLYKIQHLDASEVEAKLAELGVIQAQSNNSSQRITGTPRSVSGNTARLRAAAAARQTGETSSETGNGSEILQDEPQVIVVEATNSLLINATPEQHQRISDIIKYVDNETEMSKIPYVIYPLENQNPDDMASILDKLLQQTVVNPESKTAGKSTSTGTTTTTTSTAASASPIERSQDIVIVPDDNTFSLIVYANQRNQEWIKNLIQTLDKRRPQVLIEVSLVEITKNDEFNYDLSAIQSFPDLTNTSGLTSGLLGDTTKNLVAALSSPSATPNHIVDLQSNSGDGTVFYGDKHINALLKLIQQKSYGRVMAKPKVLVNDNETGTIDTTDKTYVKTTGTAIPNNAQTSTITTSVQYSAYPTGITLTIAPHISEGNLLRLDIELKRSDIKATYTDGRPPDTTESNIKTVVTVPDKSTIILGGLTKLNQGKSSSKVPLLGDLPLIGGLFRGISNQDTQNHVYMFVKAEIIRPADVLNGTSDLVDISERQRMAFERHEAGFQNSESWPGLKEKTITPERVLDAQ